MMIGKKYLYVIFIIALIAWSGIVYGEDVELSSVVNATEISINDRLVLTVSVSGSDANKAGDPELGPLPEFSISRAGTSTEMNIINFKTSIMKKYTYVLVPMKVGIFDVGAASVKVGGNIVSATSTKVKVVSRTTAQTQTEQNTQTKQSSENGNIFVNALVDKKEVYVGEQITYTFELYNRLTLSDTEYEPPLTTGFWSMELQQIPKSVKTAGNKQYYYYVIKTALFPTTSGELTIGPASLSYSDFFSFGQTRTQALHSDPIAIKVKPLPDAGRPGFFKGATGNFNISLSVDNTEPKVGDIVTVRISVTGQGNLDLISAVEEPDLSAFKKYDPKATEEISNSGFIIGGTKTWEYVLIPRQQGNVMIEPFSISFFDPEDKMYHTASTQALELDILPADAPAINENIAFDKRNPINKIASDINFIKPDKTILKNADKHIYSSFYFFLLYAFPLAVFITSTLYKKRQDTIEKNSGLKRKLNSWKNAQKRLDEASQMLKIGDIKNFCGILHEGLTCFIGDRLNMDTGSLTSINMEDILKDNGISPELAEHFRKTVEMTHFVRFAAIGTEHEVQNKLLDDTRKIIYKLRDVL